MIAEDENTYECYRAMIEILDLHNLKGKECLACIISVIWWIYPRLERPPAQISDEVKVLLEKWIAMLAVIEMNEPFAHPTPKISEVSSVHLVSSD